MTKKRSDPVYSAALGVGLTLMKFLRVKPTVRGVENIPDEGGAVLAITHFGYMDFVLAEWTVWRHNRRHVRFLATKAAFDKPVVGTLMRGMRHIAVDMSAGAEAYRNAVDALRDGEILGVFPEGGVNASYTVRELKTGAVRMAAEAGVPVIPIAIWGGHRLKTKTAKSSFGEKFGLPVSFAIAPAITVGPVDDVADVTVELHDVLQNLVDDLQATYPVDGTGQSWQPAHLGGTAPTPEEAARVEAERQARKRTEREGELKSR
jgi:1-acyl-sn-glycerol-3-phosphate acyltransferase